MLQAWLFLEYGITSFDSFNGYWMDYIIYGMGYKMLSIPTDFQEINFGSIDNTIVCYNLNGWGTAGGTAPTRTTSG